MTRQTLVLVALLWASMPYLSATDASAQGIREVEVAASELVWNESLGAPELFALFKHDGRDYFAISLDGGRTIATTRPVEPKIMMRHHRFDPLIEQPTVPAPLRAREGQRLHLVQFHTQPVAGWTTAMTAAGAEVLQLFPWQARLVRCDAATLETIAALPFVRWIGSYEPAFRLNGQVRDALLAGNLGARRYWIHVTEKGPAEKAALGEFITTIGGKVADYVSPHGYLIEAKLDAAQLVEVLNRDEVLFIDPWSAPEDDLDIVRQFNGADYIETMGGYSGNGVRAEVQDSGLVTTHPDFIIPPIIHVGNGTSVSHGSSVYGVVFGTGLNNPQARGLLPDAQGIFHAYSAITDRYVETGELLQNPWRCVFQTNSWGDARTFFYTTVSADMDNILFDHDVVVLQSQSNAGNQDSRPQAWAKNIVSVGGIRHYDTLTETDDAWASGASIGPADDGRIKPDISAFYDSTLAANSSGGYSNFSGTSNATPVTAGHMGLIHEMWADGIFGNSLVSWDVFDNKPTATTAKALLLNSATQYAFSGAAHDLTRVHQGWGRPDVRSLYDLRNKIQWVDQTDIIAPLATNTYTYNVQAGEPELRVTMIYADPPGNPSASVHRINDLTVRVTSPGGNVYWGNEGLLTANYSTPGGSPNNIDTVEQVLVQNPAPGTWLVEVFASQINVDGHVETPALDADYSLVVSGVDPAPGPTPDSGQANQSDAIFGIRDSLNLNGQKPRAGVNGPFFVSLDASSPMELVWEGPINRTFLLLYGPLNRTNEVFPGGIGNLDIGLVGPGNYSDIQTLMNGLAPVGFFDLFANTGPSGRRTLTVPVPPAMSGVLGAFQTIFWDGPTNTIRMSAATEVSVN